MQFLLLGKNLGWVMFEGASEIVLVRFSFFLILSLTDVGSSELRINLKLIHQFSY